jgi:hypothetical protein
MSVGILRLQEGLDFSQHYADDAASKIKNSTESLPRNQSYSQMSQGESAATVDGAVTFLFAASSTSDISVPNTPITRNREVVNVCPNVDDSAKKPKSIGGSLSEIVVDDLFDMPRERMSQMFQFQKKQKRGGYIDVWWLYDDGG